jgi:hypothetical protein
MANDPISSLVAFAQDIKPYHTKIVEILVDYIYSETTNVSVFEHFTLDLLQDINRHSGVCLQGFGVHPWGDRYTQPLDMTVDIGYYPIDPDEKELLYTLGMISQDEYNTGIKWMGKIITKSGQVFGVDNIISPDILVFAGDQTASFGVGSAFTIMDSFSNNGSWKVRTSAFDATNNRTNIRVEYDSTKLYLKMFSAYSVIDQTGTRRDVIYVTGNLSNYYGVGDTLNISNSVDGQNGSWNIIRMCYKTNFTELVVQHLTDTNVGGDVYTVLSDVNNVITVNNAISYPILKVTEVYPTFIDNDVPTNTSCKAALYMLDMSAAAAVFELSGQLTTAFSVGQLISIQNSTGNDGIWKILNVSYGFLHNVTSLTVSFNRIITALDSSNDPSNLWYGIDELKLDTELTNSNVITYSISNYDFPDECSSVSATTAATKIREHIKMDTSFPLINYPYKISGLIQPNPSAPSGSFIVPGDMRSNFPVGSTFMTNVPSKEVESWKNVLQYWTVNTVLYNTLLNQTYVNTIEQVPTVLDPAMELVVEVASFKDVINVSTIENKSPPSWEFYYYSAPTSTIYSTSSVDNTITLLGDVGRFYPVGSFVTLQHSDNDLGAWVWTVIGTTVVPATPDYPIGQTVIALNAPLTDSVPYGTISGQPTWLSGVGWDQAGWSGDENNWVYIVDADPLTPQLTITSNYDMFVNDQGSFDSTFFDLGGFGDIIQQILPL